MFKHILVTLDGTPRSETVLPHAIDMARAMQSSITLVRVVDALNGNWSERGSIGRGKGATTVNALFDKQAESYLERVSEQVRAAGVPVHIAVRHGDAAPEIVALAREIDADSIAIATRSRRGINKLVFGSVADQVLQDSQLPVLVVRAAS